MARVLIADDKPVYRSYLKSLLQGHDCEVECANDGAEALALARQSTPDIIISDVLMPKMDGYTLLRHCKADPQLRALPFIIFTATYPNAEDEQLALNLGADAFILKTAKPAAIISQLRELLARTPSSPPSLPGPPLADENTQLKLYNEVLIRKLEERTLQLDEANRKLRLDLDELTTLEAAQRQSAQTQMAIMNSLPAHIALVDARGVILSVNEAWRHFASANVLQGPDFCLGQNYIDVCERARGDCSEEANTAAAGIRQVLQGELQEFSLEYPCHSPTEQRWFRLMVTPLHHSDRAGAVIMHVNITERKRYELSLRSAQQTAQESQRQLSFAMEAANVGDWSLDLRTNVAHRSLRHDHCFGYTQPVPEWGYDTFLAHVDPVDRDHVDTGFKKAMAGLGEYNHEFRTTWRDGSVHWLWTRGRFYFDETGKTSRVAGIVADITARKQLEESLHAAERRLSGAFKYAPIGVALVSPAGRYLQVNPALCELFGYTEAELLSRSFQSLTHPDDLAAEAEFLRRLFADEIQTFQMEKRYITAAGKVVPALVDVSLVRDDQGQPVYQIKQIQDITERKRSTELIVQGRERLQLATESAQIGIWDWDVVNNILLWDARMYQLYGFQESDFSGAYEAWQAGLHPDDRQAGAEATTAAIKGEKDFHIEFRVLWPNGEVRHLEAHAMVQRADDGSATRMIGVNWDITERKQAALRINYLNHVHVMLSGINTLIVRANDRDELFSDACRIAVEAGGFAMALIGLVDGAALQVNPVASRGRDAEQVVAVRHLLSSHEIASTAMIARVVKEKAPVVSNDSANDPQVAAGNKYAEAGIRSLVLLPLIMAHEVIGVFALYSDQPDFFHDEETRLLTELAGDIAFAMDHIDKQQRINYLAYYDGLTGLANRSLFVERLAQHKRNATSEGHKLALILFDLERFRNVNDSLGRRAGDDLLRRVAEWLTSAAGDSSLLARVGADQFVVVVPAVQQAAEVARLLDKTTAAFAQHPFQLNGIVLRAAVKVGVAVFPDDGTDTEILFRNAEAALKTAKAKGERYLFYTADMTAAIADKLTLENQLRQALDHGEFVLHYQPKQNLASGKLVGAEALIRWNDPLTGLVPPGRFIPILEETGLIHEVGRWALAKALEDYLRWRNSGLPVVRIGVNVSPRQLRSQDFVAEIKQALSIDADAAAGLELEITESLIMEDIKHSVASLQAIRELGVTIAIDDFGTGFSSLSYLTRLPVNSLKIDRSFVVDMTSGPDELALVSTIIKLAQSLQLNVVAEGVETQEQARLLRLLNCNEMQGYLFSKPLPADEFERTFLLNAVR